MIRYSEAGMFKGRFVVVSRSVFFIGLHTVNILRVAFAVVCEVHLSVARIRSFDGH